jgi:hypothetical protein
MIALIGLLYATSFLPDSNYWRPPNSFYINDQITVNTKMQGKDLQLHWQSKPLKYVTLHVGEKLSWKEKTLLIAPYRSISIEPAHLEYLIQDRHWEGIIQMIRFSIAF